MVHFPGDDVHRIDAESTSGDSIDTQQPRADSAQVRRQRAGDRPPTGRARPKLVVVGTSWGGLDAVSTLLDHLPPTIDCPIALVQHRGVRPSELTRLLGRHTARAVCEADDKQAIAPGTVYIAPPDYHLLIEHDRFALSTEGPVRFSRPSIDVLFESAADSYGERLVGVVLTGANDDGSRGLARIQSRGGYTLVQDPATAARADMPRAALSRVVPDVVGSLDELAESLTAVCRVWPGSPVDRDADRHAAPPESWTSDPRTTTGEEP